MKIKLTQLESNTGQIEGLPSNPRLIRNERFDKLKQSLIDDPEMTDYRGLLVYPKGKKYVVLGGNQRLEAAKDLGWKEIECVIVDKKTPVEKMRLYEKEFYIKEDLREYQTEDIFLSESEMDMDHMALKNTFPKNELLFSN